MVVQLWRLYRAVHGPGLDGIGGTIAGGRWHTQGQKAVYFGATPAIVVLERLAHTDPDLLPDDLRLGCFEFRKTVNPVEISEQAKLTPNWTEDEPASRKLGTGWLREKSSCVLKVPSALLPEESNYLFNPQHPDAEHLYRLSERPFAFDSRLI